MFSWIAYKVYMFALILTVAVIGVVMICLIEMHIVRTLGVGIHTMYMGVLDFHACEPIKNQ
jgi:hypothetical protein